MAESIAARMGRLGREKRAILADLRAAIGELTPQDRHLIHEYARVCREIGEANMLCRIMASEGVSTDH